MRVKLLRNGKSSTHNPVPSLLRWKKEEFSISLNINFASLSIFASPALSPPHGFDHFNVVNSSLSFLQLCREASRWTLLCIKWFKCSIMHYMWDPLKKCKLSQSIKPPQPSVTRDITQFFFLTFLLCQHARILQKYGFFNVILKSALWAQNTNCFLCYLSSSIERYPSRIFDVSENKFKKTSLSSSMD